MATNVIDQSNARVLPLPSEAIRAAAPTESRTDETWSFKRFARGAVVVGGLAAIAFGLPISLIAVANGMSWLLWVCVPQLLIATMLLGGILSATFLMDSPDDPVPASPSRPRANRTPRRRTATTKSRRAA